MKLTKEQIKFISYNENLIVASSANNMPRAIMVIPSVVNEDGIIISNIQMETTNQNIRKNSNIFLISYNKNYSKWMKITGNAELYSNGELFEEIKTIEEKRCPMPVKEIIVVKIKSIVSGEE